MTTDILSRQGQGLDAKYDDEAQVYSSIGCIMAVVAAVALIAVLAGTAQALPTTWIKAGNPKSVQCSRVNGGSGKYCKHHETSKGYLYVHVKTNDLNEEPVVVTYRLHTSYCDCGVDPATPYRISQTSTSKRPVVEKVVGVTTLPPGCTVETCVSEKVTLKVKLWPSLTGAEDYTIRKVGVIG